MLCRFFQLSLLSLKTILQLMSSYLNAGVSGYAYEQKRRKSLNYPFFSKEYSKLHIKVIKIFFIILWNMVLLVSLYENFQHKCMWVCVPSSQKIQKFSLIIMKIDCWKTFRSSPTSKLTNKLHFLELLLSSYVLTKPNNIQSLESYLLLSELQLQSIVIQNYNKYNDVKLGNTQIY